MNPKQKACLAGVLMPGFARTSPAATEMEAAMREKFKVIRLPD